MRDGTYATANYGTATGLVVKKDGTGYSRETYLKFSLKGVKGDVQNAKLKVYSSGGKATANTTKWQLWKSNTNSWTETGINWNNKPVADTLLDSIPGQIAPGYCYWNISNQLRNIGADSTLTLKIVSTVLGGNTDVTFYSKETSGAGQRPYIVYTTDTSNGYSEQLMPKARLTQAAITEITQQAPVAALKLFPNPAVTHCVIQSRQLMKSISVFNAAGVLLKTVSNINANQYRMNVNDLPKGMYFFTITGDHLSEKTRLLKLN